MLKLRECGKTYKREVACLLLVFWGLLATLYFAGAVDDTAGGYGETLRHITSGVLMFAGGAFGLDQYKKMKGGQ